MGNFKIIVAGIEYNVEKRTLNDFFRVWNERGTYDIIRDKNGIWVFHAHVLGSRPIPLTDVGREIENYYRN